jgi:thymidine kinase
MFSGKTTKLLDRIDKAKYKKEHVVVFKPSMDKRYSTTQITSHSGMSIDAIQIETGSDLVDYILSSKVEQCDIIAVDEAFMINGLADALNFFYRHGKDIYVSTLDLSSSCKPFKEAQDILPYATRIEKCVAVCTYCGSDAQYTYKKIDDGNVISIGGHEKYEPRCWSHHPLINKIKYGQA